MPTAPEWYPQVESDNAQGVPRHNTLERLRLAYQVGTEIASIRDLDELLEKVIYHIGTTLNYPPVSLALIEGDMLCFKPRRRFYPGQSVPEPVKIRVGQHITGWVAEKGETLWVPDVSHDSRFLNIDGSDIRSELAIPLKRGSRVIGVLNVESSRLNDFSPEDQIVLELLADQIAAAIENTSRF